MNPHAPATPPLPVLPFPAAPTSLVTALRRAARYEIRRLQGLTSTRIVLGLLCAVSVLNGILLRTDLPTAPNGEPLAVSTADLADWLQHSPTAQQVPLSALLLVFVFGSGPVAGELRYGTARTTWLTLGSRGIAYTAKLLVGATAVLSAAALSLLLQTAVGATALALTGAPQPAWTEAGGPVLRYLLVMGCWPVLGAGLAALLRSRVATVLALTLWPILAERLTGLLLAKLPGFDGIAEVLPFAAARAAMRAEPATDPFTQALVGSSLPAGAATALFVLFTLAVGALGWFAYARRSTA
ncbi:hypothetical protein [Streptomyces paromomycinus]|uniref:Uncharacterized protein n=1 Tax=Streptomyces paromomycinus TaxID=92743 RepID=A0A401WBM1_STREY|nr:hypothetical protein [Streptomyces paromomycinus]GCD46702.1 hypothetical protein GKJPGBOP_06453 [Streptomyces paromomycinus]